MSEARSRQLSTDRRLAGAAAPRRLRLATPTMALMFCAAFVLLLVASIVIPSVGRGVSTGYGWLVPYAAVGFVIAHRQPGNPIGWIMLISSTVTIFCGDAGGYAVLIYHDGDHALPLGRLAVALASGWVVFVVTLPLPIVLFPDGRLPTGRWRLTVWVYGALFGLLVIRYVVGDIPAFTDRYLQIDSTGELTRLDNSGGGPESVAYVALILSWVVMQALSYRRSNRERRAQLKWLLSGGMIAIAGFVVSGLVPADSPQHLAFGGVMALPVCMAVGILKYRLYEIDRLISRTLSYAILTALLVGTFVGLVAVTTDLLSFSSSVGVAASTLAAAALFNPLRRRVQRAVDRRFNRARYDADATVAAFSARLRDAVDLDTVQADLLDVVQRSVEPSHATVWIRPTNAGVVAPR